MKNFDKAIGKKISAAHMKDNTLYLNFEEGGGVMLLDTGQDCCENRYMTSDDDLSTFKGSEIIGVEIASGGFTEGNHGDCHEIEFLRIKTSSGDLVCQSHNEHNGYYGGISVKCYDLQL